MIIIAEEFADCKEWKQIMRGALYYHCPEMLMERVSDINICFIFSRNCTYLKQVYFVLNKTYSKYKVKGKYKLLLINRFVLALNFSKSIQIIN